MVKGFFNQHWAGTNAVGDTIRFDPYPSEGLAYGYGSPILLNDMSYFQTAGNILPVSGTTTEITMSVWIRPQVTETTGDQFHYIFKVSEQVNDDHAYLQIIKPSGYTNVAYVSLKFGGVSLNFAPQRLINFNQWNHILFSVKNKGATFSFGHQDGEDFDLTTKIVKNAGSSRGDRTHLVINGTAFHRFAVPRQSGYTSNDPGGWTTNHGYFRNDFASGDTGASATFGYYSTNITDDDTDTNDPNYPNNNEGDVVSGSATDDTIFGGHYGTANPQTGVNYFRGEMFQFWLKDQYYDLLNSSNVDLFYNSGSPVSSLPASPSVLFKAGLNGPDNDGTVNVGSIVTNRLSTGIDPS